MNTRMERYKALVTTFTDTLAKHAATVEAKEQEISELHNRIDAISLEINKGLELSANIRKELTAVRALVRTLEDDELTALRLAEDQE